MPVDPRTPTKMGKRFIQIKPAFEQSIINEKESQLVDEDGKRVSNLSAFNNDGQPIIMGNGTQTIWSNDTTPKMFKVRLTSKKTGRKIDFNIYCKSSHLRNPDA
jgi:hypothetical protein